MKNLKKVLAFVVVFAMMLTCSVSAASFPDVADDASYAEAATVLSSLGLMVGDDLGNFNPDKILTRAESTALIMRAKGLESAAAGAAGATQFNDVPATHWASGYINLAAQSNVVNGYGDGNFGPEDEVKYEQFVKMLVAALDYEPKANLYGGYPSGYLIIASQKDITKSVPGTAGQPVPRKAVAQMLFNALDVGMMELTLDNKGTVQYSDGDDTLLKTYLYIDQYEGILKEAKYAPNADDSIAVTVSGDWEEVVAGEYFDTNKTSFNQGETNAETLRGYAVALYVATDAVSGKEYIKAIAPKTGKNEVVTVDYTQLANPTMGEDEDDNEIIEVVKYYADPADYSTEDIVLDAEYKSIYNNSSVGYEAASVEAFLTQAATGEEVNGKAIFVNNDGDDDFDYVFVSSYETNDVVDAVDAVAGTVTGKNGELVDLEQKNAVWSFIKAGEVVDFEDIAVGNVLSTQVGKNGTYDLYTVYISDTVIEGAATELRTTNGDRYITIGTEEYHDPSQLVLVGDEGKFYLNVDNKIVYADAIRPAAGNYAVMLDAAINTQGIGSGAVEVKFLTIDGEWKVVKVADRVSYQAADATRGTLLDSAELGANEESAFFGIYKLEKDDNGNLVVNEKANELFQYEIDSAGKLSKIVMPKDYADDDDFSIDVARAEVTYKASSNRLGSVYLGENTKVFHIDEDDALVGKEESITVAGTSLFRDGEAYDVEIIDKDLNGYPELVVVYNANPGIDAGTHPLVISKVVSSTNEAGYEITKFYGIQAGQEVQVDSVEGGIDKVEVTVDKLVRAFGDDAADLADFIGLDAIADYEVAAGDVVLFGLDAKGAVERLDVIMSAKLAYATADAAVLAKDADQDITGTFDIDGANTNDTKASRNFFGYASKTLTNGRVVLNYQDGANIVAETEILRGQDLFFYNVNLNGYVSGRMSVKADTISAITATNKADKAGSWVFVREFEEAPVCVVVYSYNNVAAVDVDTASGALADAQ